MNLVFKPKLSFFAFNKIKILTDISHVLFLITFSPLQLLNYQIKTNKKERRIMKKLFFAAVMLSFLIACGGGESTPESSTKAKPQSMVKKEIDPMQDKGVGVVTELVLPAEIDPVLAAKGDTIYQEKCTACHKPTEKFIGPAPKGVLDRRTPEWIMNMILDPERMVKENAAAKKLLIEFNGSPMANQNLTEEQARAVLEYFRTL